MAHLAKSVLRPDDEAELLDPHRMYHRDNGFRSERTSRANGASGPALGRATGAARLLPRR